MKLEPPKYEMLDAEEAKELMKLFQGEKTGYVTVGPKKWFFPSRYIEHGEGYYNFKARPDDTWVVSHPRSGTTWTQELVWLLSNNLDFKRASQEYLAHRFPFLELSLFNHPAMTLQFLELNKGDKKKEELVKAIAKPGYEDFAELPSPRFMKSHFPFSLLPGILDTGCKVINCYGLNTILATVFLKTDPTMQVVYVARNPKDVVASWYHFNVSIKTQSYKGDFATFVGIFMNNRSVYSPYWEHIKEAWALRHHPNLLFIFYEELQHDFLSTSKKIAKFLGKSYTDEQLGQVATYLSIDNFRKNQMVNASELKECGIITPNSFVRKGQTGGSKDMFTPELNAKMNKWIEENLAGTDIVFPYFKLFNDNLTGNDK